MNIFNSLLQVMGKELKKYDEGVLWFMWQGCLTKQEPLVYRTPAEFESFAGFITTSLSWLQNETSEQMPMFLFFF